MAIIQNLERLYTKLRAKVAESIKGDDGVVVVGYTAAYAIHVHENLQAYHRVGQAKFLEQPARELGPEMAGDVRRIMKQGKTLTTALLVAGLRLQRESQKLVPIDTGALRASAFTRVEKGEAA